MVIPRYQGFIPKVAANNKFGKTISDTARKVFTAKKIEDKPHMFATTG